MEQNKTLIIYRVYSSKPGAFYQSLFQSINRRTIQVQRKERRNALNESRKLSPFFPLYKNIAPRSLTEHLQ